MITSLVAKIIVKTLEVIDVNQHQGQGMLITGGALPFHIETLFKGTTVG